jgi:hypothetical protein
MKPCIYTCEFYIMSLYLYLLTNVQLWMFLTVVYTLCFSLLCLLDRRLGAYCFCPVCHSVTIVLSSVKNFNLGYNFWMVSTTASIFHMSISCDKTFYGYKKFDFFTLTFVIDLHVLIENTLNVVISFHWKVLRLWHFMWVVFFIRSFHGCKNVWPCDVDLVCPTF